MWGLAAIAFVAIYFFGIAFPLIVLAAGIVELMGGKLWREKFLVIKGHGGTKSTSLIDDDVEAAEHTRPTLSRTLKVLTVCLALWWGSVLLLALLLGWDHTILREGVFFSKAAMVTFGGAYAVLPYVSQQAVELYGWLTAGQMLDGLGLAETTPGPLIMVLQFVGFLGGWNHPHSRLQRSVP